MIGRVRSRWERLFLVCGKCEKKLHGGFGAEGDRRLAKLLRKRAGGRERKAEFGVITTKCLKLCPKDSVTVVDGKRPDEWLVIPAGTPMDEIETQLGIAERDTLIIA